MERIERFVWRFGYDAEAVLLKITEDEMFAAWFAKEPRRQSPHERIAADYLTGFPELLDFKRLPQSGKNAFTSTATAKYVEDRKFKVTRRLKLWISLGKPTMVYSATRATSTPFKVEAIRIVNSMNNKTFCGISSPVAQTILRYS